MFNIGKKKEELPEKSCCCDNITAGETNLAEGAKTSGGFKVLGGGCAKCHELAANTKAALFELGINENVELITDYSVIASYGVMSTPALVIDNKVVSFGKVLKKSEIVDAVRASRSI